MQTAELERNICDTVKEWQIKIGYSEEKMELYYPEDSLMKLVHVSSEEELKDALTQFITDTKERLGTVAISESDGRFCIEVPKEGTRYIHEHIPDSPFLKAFLKTVVRYDCTLKNIREVFQEFSPDFVEEDQNDSHLGTVFYFRDPSVDPFIYCVSFGAFGAEYHRFTKEDFEEVRK